MDGGGEGEDEVVVGAFCENKGGDTESLETERGDKTPCGGTGSIIKNVGGEFVE